MQLQILTNDTTPQTMTTKSKKSGTTDELVEALLAPKVIDAITDAIVSRVLAAVETKLMGAVESKLSELSNSIAELSSKWNTSITELSSKVEQTERENIELLNRVNSLERYQRQDNLIIYGIKERSYAERSSAMQSQSDTQDLPVAENSQATEETIIKFCRDKLQVTVAPNDISVAHRLARPSGSTVNKDLPLPIIVKFTNRKVRQRILAVRKSLKTSAPGVFINENLTTFDAEIHKKARVLAKAKKISKTWTHNGLVMIQKDNLITTRPVTITNLDQLNRY